MDGRDHRGSTMLTRFDFFASSSHKFDPPVSFEKLKPALENRRRLLQNEHGHLVAQQLQLNNNVALNEDEKKKKLARVQRGIDNNRVEYDRLDEQLAVFEEIQQEYKDCVRKSSWFALTR